MNIKTEDIIQKLEPVLNAIFELFKLPGMAVGIVQNDEILYAKGFGVKKLGEQNPISENTNFHMASISKPFTAISIMQLVEKGKIDINLPVITYLPYFKLDDERYPKITVQQMLSHVSGMPDTEDYGWEKPEFDGGSLERYVRSIKDLKLLTDPDEVMAYSNIAYEVLGDLIAKVSGQNFEDYIKKHIFTPLNMSNSTFLLKESPPKGDEAMSHLWNLDKWVVDDIYPYNRAHAPSSTLHSNILDMCNWARVNINKGTLNGVSILKPKSYDLLWHEYAPTNFYVSYLKFIGLSWFLGEYNGNKVVSHAGGDRGFRTQFILFPDQKFGIVLMLNGVPCPALDIVQTIMDFMVGKELKMLKLPFSYPFGKILINQSIEDAKEWYYSLENHEKENLDFNEETYFSLISGLEQLNKHEEIRDILDLWLEKHPDSTWLTPFLKKYCN